MIAVTAIWLCSVDRARSPRECRPGHWYFPNGCSKPLSNSFSTSPLNAAVAGPKSCALHLTIARCATVALRGKGTYPLNAGVAVRLVGNLSLRLLNPAELNPLDEGKPKFWDNCLGFAVMELKARDRVPRKRTEPGADSLRNMTVPLQHSWDSGCILANRIKIAVSPGSKPEVNARGRAPAAIHK